MKGIHQSSNLKYTHKKKIELSWWPITCLIGNIIQVFASCLALSSYQINSTQEILIGIGCMICYCGIGRYIEYNSEYSAIYSTLKSSLPNVLRYLFGVMPIFFGFTFLGLCLFWRSDRFATTSSTMFSLFALMHGDSVFDVLSDLSGISFFLGQIYVYIFCTLFIVIVLNVFISIIEEAYIIKKLQNKTHWVNNYLKIDSQNVILKKDPEELVRRKIHTTMNLTHISKGKVNQTSMNLSPHTMFSQGVSGIIGDRKGYQAPSNNALEIKKKATIKQKESELPWAHTGSLNYSYKMMSSFKASQEKENLLKTTTHTHGAHGQTSQFNQAQHAHFGGQHSAFKDRKVLDDKTKLEIDKVVENHFGSVTIILINIT